MTTPTRTIDTRAAKPEVIAITAQQLAVAWNTLHLAQMDLLRALEKYRHARTVGSVQRLRATFQVFLDAVATFDRAARAVTERWAARDLPVFYRNGALAALDRTSFSVRMRAAPFSWGPQHQAAITALSAQYYTDLISRIAEAVRRAQAFAREAQAQARTHKGVDRKQLIEAHPLDTVVYRDQSKHPVMSWAAGALAVQATAATNAAALNYGVWDLEALWFECTDGPECGFAGHQDADHASGTIRSAEDAAMWPVSHFGCIRQWTPRPDLNLTPGLASGDSL